MTICFTADKHFRDHRTLSIWRRSLIDVGAKDERLIELWTSGVGPHV